MLCVPDPYPTVSRCSRIRLLRFWPYDKDRCGRWQLYIPYFGWRWNEPWDPKGLGRLDSSAANRDRITSAVICSFYQSNIIYHYFTQSYQASSSSSQARTTPIFESSSRSRKDGQSSNHQPGHCARHDAGQQKDSIWRPSSSLGRSNTICGIQLAHLQHLLLHGHANQEEEGYVANREVASQTDFARAWWQLYDVYSSYIQRRTTLTIHTDLTVLKYLEPAAPGSGEVRIIKIWESYD